MENSKILNRINNFIAILGTVSTGAMFRLIPHPPNMAPIAALALFSGANINGVSAFLLPLSAMILSDLVLGFHNTVFYVYGSFALMVVIGKMLKNKRSFKILTVAAFSSSVLFFLITNFGVWLSGSMYPKNIFGLIEAYMMGLPFFRNTILGDIFYTMTFFYGYDLIKAISSRLFFHYKTTLSSSSSSDSFKI